MELLNNIVMTSAHALFTNHLCFDLIFTYKLVFGLIELNLSDFFMRETVAINTNFSFLVAVQVQDITFIYLPGSKNLELLTS